MNVRVKQRITPKHNNQQSTLSARCKLAVNQWLGYLQPPLSSFFSFFFSYQACPNAPLLSAGKEDSDGRSTATSESTEATEEGEEQPSLADGLTSFQKLVFVKAFREEKVRIGIFSHVFRKFVFILTFFAPQKSCFAASPIEKPTTAHAVDQDWVVYFKDFSTKMVNPSFKVRTRYKNLYEGKSYCSFHSKGEHLFHSGLLFHS